MTTSERRLLTVLLVIAGMGGGVILATKFKAWGAGLSRADSLVDAERQASEELLAGAALWKARGVWLDEHQPVLQSDTAADEEFDTPLVAKASAHGLEIVNRQFIEPVKGPTLSQFGVSVTVRGDLSGVFGWLCEMQSPEKFLVVPSFKITPDKTDPSRIVCALQLARWYRSKPQTPG